MYFESCKLELIPNFHLTHVLFILATHRLYEKPWATFWNAFWVNIWYPDLENMDGEQLLKAAKNNLASSLNLLTHLEVKSLQEPFSSATVHSSHIQTSWTKTEKGHGYHRSCWKKNSILVVYLYGGCNFHNFCFRNQYQKLFRKYRSPKEQCLELDGYNDIGDKLAMLLTFNCHHTCASKIALEALFKKIME